MVCIKMNSIQKDQSLWQVSESSGKAWLFVRNRIHRIGLSRATDCWCTFCDLSGVVRNYSNDSACCPRDMKEICMYRYAINIPEGDRVERSCAGLDHVSSLEEFMKVGDLLAMQYSFFYFFSFIHYSLLIRCWLPNYVVSI